jgi:hypothetical protein
LPIVHGEEGARSLAVRTLGLVTDVIAIERHVPIDGIFNLRDLGGYETPDGPIVWRRLFRADGIHRIPESSIDTMRTARSAVTG